MSEYNRKREGWLIKMVARGKGNKEQLVALKMLRDLKRVGGY